jgi:tetratricopeptide (TPR) repeat protein
LNPGFAAASQHCPTAGDALCQRLDFLSGRKPMALTGNFQLLTDRNGIIMETAKSTEEYIQNLRMTIAQNPECGTSRYNMAVALLSQRKFEEAEKEFREAIDCSPGMVEAYVQLGGICMQRGDLEGCLAYNKKAVQLRPSFSEGYGNIGFVYMQLGKIDEAIQALERATFFNFRFVQALTTLANAYLMKGEIDKCIETNLKAVAIQPDFAVAHNNLAIAYLEKGEKRLAVEHADKAVELGYEMAPEILQEIALTRKELGGEGNAS